MKTAWLRIFFSTVLTMAQLIFHPWVSWADTTSSQLPYSDEYQSRIKANLRQLEALQAAKNSCSTWEAGCPKSLERLQSEDYSSKALILSSYAPTCMEKVDPKQKGAENFAQFPNARDMQSYFAKNYFPELGSFNHEAVRRCQSGNDYSDRYRTAKFYYDMKRLNEGAESIVEELAGIQSLLGDGDEFRCAGGMTFPQASSRCEQLKSCPAIPNNLKAIADESEKKEAAYKAVVQRMQELEKNCLKNAKEILGLESRISGAAGPGKNCEQYLSPVAGSRTTCKNYTMTDVDRIHQCEQERNLLAISETSLASQYPWFRNKNFFEYRKSLSSTDAIKKTSLENRAALKAQYDEFFNAGQCLNGLADVNKHQDCSNETLRKAIDKAPALPSQLPDQVGDRRKFMSASVYLFAQQCMHDGVKKQNKDASEITSGVANASLSLLAVAMTGGLAAVGRAALTVRGAATVENIAAASRVAASASRVFNLGVDGLNFSKEVVDVFDGCKDKLAAVELASKQKQTNQCPNHQSAKSQAEKEYSDCISVGSLLKVGGALAPFAVPAVVRTVTKYKNEMKAKAAINASDEAQAVNSEASLRGSATTSGHLERRNHVKDLEPVKVTRLKEVKAPGTSDGLKVYKNKRENGEVFETYEYVVEVPGKGAKVVTAELPRDPLTGAIDANLPSGRKFLDLMVQGNQGKSYLAFLDVGNLGFVNRSFKSGMKGGDEYLKKVAHVIKSVGGDKITLVKLGGDEFAIVIHEIDPEKARLMMQKISDEMSSSGVHQVFKDEKLARAADFREKLYEKFPNADPKKYEADMAKAFTDEERQIIANKRETAEKAMESSSDYKEALREATLADRANTMQSSLETSRSQMAQSPEYIAASNQYRQDFVPYSKETASIGITEIGVGERTEAVIARAEDAATPMKVEGKVVMNQDATKQGGPVQDRNVDPTTGKMTRIAKPSQKVLVGDPTPAPKGAGAVKPLPAVDPSLPRMTYSEGREVGRYTKFSVVESTDELGNMSYKLKKYVNLPDGTRKHIDYEVARNAKTGFIDGNTEHAKEFLNAIVSEKTNTTIIMGDAPELGKINYFKNKSADGDRYIEAVAKAVNSVKRGEDIAFKVKGSEFVIEVENISAADLSSLKTRLQKAVKESPEIQNIFKEQQQYLESELKRNPGSADLKKQLENLGKIRRDIDLTSTPTKAGDTAETVLARTRDEIKQSRAQHSK